MRPEEATYSHRLEALYVVSGVSRFGVLDMPTTFEDSRVRIVEARDYAKWSETYDIVISENKWRKVFSLRERDLIDGVRELSSGNAYYFEIPPSLLSLAAPDDPVVAACTRSTTTATFCRARFVLSNGLGISLRVTTKPLPADDEATLQLLDRLNRAIERVVAFQN